MKPLFTIHEGEFLVGDYITRKLAAKYDVWVPVKDSGVDLLVTPRKKNRRPVKLQVKFSRGFTEKQLPAEEVLAFGWYRLDPAKLRKSRADLWVFAILTLRHKAHYIIIPTKELKRRIPRGMTGAWTLYLMVFRRKKCYDLRGVKKAEKRMTLMDGPKDRKRDYSEYLNKWKLLDEMSRTT